ncbi:MULTISPECIES: single-stranded DNA-binding protein [unclassified Gemella]|uniref:single-stranded DNA-binding protein n=1 Tax=unclassified Gemella TaxID=2624949 RepID=UPI001C05D56F|nr:MULTISPECIES: single-stranded DNA-binding protein [unclassified Gemella]MBU0279008.1 single-stranded DNA-binding protein [Gemella sp. zg-1178]QWQ38728.1 single-stranded DNA-binding protein [Gemella sp. zg-570]
MINNVVLVGRLTKDPELRYSSSNIPMIYFTLAVNRTFADQNGQRNADFVSCVVFRKQAENMARFLAKGSLIGVIGRIQTRNYQGKDGNMVYVTEVVADNIQYLESKSNTNRMQDNGFGSMSFNQQPQNNFSSFSGNTNNNNNTSMYDFMNDNSSFTDFGEDFPSNLDDDFMQDVVNPFKED